MTSESGLEPRRITLEALRGTLQREVEINPNWGDLRRFNHHLVGELDKCCPLAGCRLLDLGASIHGYALEAALDRDVELYEGIDFDVVRHWGAKQVEVTGSEGCTGRLRQMNAEQLAFADATFDCLLSISTFEHFHRPDLVLAEMYRVLRSGGVALVSFEPIWTASYGHHLHHFGAVSELVPPWSHLFLDEGQMAIALARQPWPAGAPIDRTAALQWIYHDGGINRHDIRRLKVYFEQSDFEIDWLLPLPDEASPERLAVATYLARLLPYTSEELLTRGLSLLLRKP